MTVLVMTAIIAGGVIAFFAGAWFVGRQLIGQYEAAQARLDEKRAAMYVKLADGIKAQFRSTVGGLPGKMGKEAMAVIEHLVKEEVGGEEGAEG